MYDNTVVSIFLIFNLIPHNFTDQSNYYQEILQQKQTNIKNQNKNEYNLMLHNYTFELKILEKIWQIKFFVCLNF